MKKLAVLSLSGGMDSTSLLLHLLKEGYEVSAISFYYGQKHSIELERVRKNLEYLKSLGIEIEHNIVDLSSIMSTFHSALTDPDFSVPEGHYADENMKKTVVSNRNAIFSSIVYGKAHSLATKYNIDVSICLGTHSGDHSIYPDCRPEFHRALDYAFRIGNWDSERISSYLPYLEGDKFTILQDAIESCSVLELDFNIIFRNTNTCYQPTEDGRSCGRCGSCTERLEAFDKLKIKDPVEYVE